MNKVVIISNSLSNVFLRRKHLLDQFINNNYEVILITENDIEFNINNKKYKLINLDFRKSKTNIFYNMIIFFKLFRLISKLNCNNILCFQIKPIFMVSLINLFLKRKIVNTFTGLGSLLINKSFLRFLVIHIFKTTLRKKNLINIFQNHHDLNYFLKRNVINKDKNKNFVINGSGIDLHKFKFTELVQKNITTFAYIGRLISDKGIMKFLNLTKYFQNRKDIKFIIVGEIDTNNFSFLKYETLKQYLSNNVEYFGHSNDVTKIISSIDCLIMPSFREGLSNIILETLALGRPVIASNVPGCKDIIIEGKNGYLFDIFDEKDLLNKVNDFLKIGMHQKKEISKFCTKSVIKYDINKITPIYYKLIHET